MLGNMLRSYSISAKMFFLLGILAAFGLAAVVSLWLTVERVSQLSLFKAQEVMLNGHKDKVRVAAHSMAMALGEILARFPAAEHGEAIRLIVHDIRYEEDRSGYYFVYEDTTNIALPPLPERQGRDLKDLHDRNGVYYVRELAARAREGGGFVEYLFPKPSGEEQVKLSYAESIPDTTYWVGTGVYIDNIDREKAVLAEVIADLFHRSLAGILLGFAAIISLLILLALAIARSVVLPLAEATGAAERIAGGDLEIWLDESGADEAARLQRALNYMARTLQHDIQVIRDRTAEAEEKAHIAEAALRETEEASQEVVRQVAQRIRSLQNISMAVAHQLRNPVTVIGGFARLLQNKPELRDKYLRYLDGIVEEASRIERISEVVREYSSIRLGKVEQVPVAEIIEAARGEAARKAAGLSREITWTVQVEPLRVCVDPLLLAAALREVLVNAVEAMDAGTGDIRITAVRQGHALALQVQDNGKGIAASELPFVFDPFYTTKAVGVGAGLSRAERIVQEHCGSITVTSEPGKGTVVEMLIPMEQKYTAPEASKT